MRREYANNPTQGNPHGGEGVQRVALSAVQREGRADGAPLETQLLPGTPAQGGTGLLEEQAGLVLVPSEHPPHPLSDLFSRRRQPVARAHLPPGLSSGCELGLQTSDSDDGDQTRVLLRTEG